MFFMIMIATAIMAGSLAIIAFRRLPDLSTWALGETLPVTSADSLVLARDGLQRVGRASRFGTGPVVHTEKTTGGEYFTGFGLQLHGQPAVCL